MKHTACSRPSHNITNTFSTASQQPTVSSNNLLTTGTNSPMAKRSQHQQCSTPTLMTLPTELRLQILSHVLTDAAGPSGTISIDPHTHKLCTTSTPPGYNYADRSLTKWRLRRGLLQTCSRLRAETLAELYRTGAFSARLGGAGFRQRAFEQWVEVLGDEGARRVRRLVVLVELGVLITAEGCADLGGEMCFDVREGRVGLEGFGGNVVGPARGKLARRLERVWRGLRAEREEGDGLGMEEWRVLWKEIMKASELFWLDKL